MQFSAKLFDGDADNIEAILGIGHEASPGFPGVADLVAIMGHG
jgi:hypothetical protein